MARKFSPKFKAAALQLLDAGVFTREAQAQLKRRFRVHVGEGTLRKWRAERDAAVAADADTETDADTSVSGDTSVGGDTSVARSGGPTSRADSVDTAAEDVDTYEHVCRQLTLAQRRADQAAADGNHTAAQRFSGDVVKYTLLKARLDKDRKGSDDTVSIPRAELERARHAMRERVALLAADLERTGGITCSHCGRELRIALAKGEK